MSYIEYIKFTDLLLKIYEVNRAAFGLRMRVLLGGSKYSRSIEIKKTSCVATKAHFVQLGKHFVLT